MRAKLITWLGPKNGFPYQAISKECKNLAELNMQIYNNGIPEQLVVEIRDLNKGDQENFKPLT